MSDVEGQPSTPPGDARGTAVRVAVVLVGHGETASVLLRAATVVAPSGFCDVWAVDAGAGDSERLAAALDDVLGAIESSTPTVVLLDLPGASPWQRCLKTLGGRDDAVMVSGLSLAMLLKVASVNRDGATAKSVADACVGSAKRATLYRVVEEG